MSQTMNDKSSSALEIAWQHHAELDANAKYAQKLHLTLRRWVIILSVVATLLAILTDGAKDLFTEATLIPETLRVILIFVPIAGSVVLAYANKFQQGERWLAMRAGAEEIKQEIYLYRTLLQDREGRHQRLLDRVANILRDVSEAVGGDLVVKPYTGQIPPYYDAQDRYSDPGFADLLPDNYIRYRLEDQLNWHAEKIAELQKQRTLLQILIFVFGGLGTFLAALGGFFNIWVALTASLAAALTAWLELRRHDSAISNYSQLVLELTIIRDHWRGLSQQERTGDEFFKLVAATEKVLWSQHSKFISEMRKAIAELKGEATDMLDEAAKMPAPAAIDKAILEIEQAKQALAPTIEKELSDETAGEQVTPEERTASEIPSQAQDQVQQPKRGAPHAFVVMPFGRKQGLDGIWLDFDSIYAYLIKPALIQAGFEPFRADEETISGDILTDMFQELLLADLVIADLSIDNANVFYELGVRHAMRKRGLVHIQSGRAYLPFDIFNVRTIPYHTGKNGKPDPQYLEKDIQAIAKIAYDTWNSGQDQVHSPIFNLLDGLKEPDRKALQTPLATNYWREYHEWEERVSIARRRRHLGDILLLTEEISNPLIQEEVIVQAGRALRSLGHHTLALQQYRKGLKINPGNLEFRREEAFHLGRLNRLDEAIVRLEHLLQEHPHDAEAVAYLGRLYKDMWTDEWENIEDDQARFKAAYESYYVLKKSVETYLSGYSWDQNHYYSGINALMLSLLLDHLAREVGPEDDVDPEVEAIRQQLPSLAGAVKFSLEHASKRENPDYWMYASLGDLAISIAKEPKAVSRAYKKALAQAGKSRFTLQSTLSQLELLDLLAFRPEYVKAGIEVLESALHKAQEPVEVEADQTEEEPLQVFLFAGHMIDLPDRPEPRFPPGMEDEARQRIEQTLDELKADPHDLAIAPGIACGGDILYIEACLKRDMKIEVYLPFPEARFIEESVSVAGDDWVERFYQIRLNPNVTIHLQPERVGPVPEGDNPFERNNRWTLYSALGYGIERIRLVVLWNGQGGDGPGGTGHMVREVRRLGGIVEHLDTTKFDYWQSEGKVGKVLETLGQGG